MARHRAHPANDSAEVPYIHFRTNAYLLEYVRNLRALIASGQGLSEQMATLKVNELLTAIHELAPDLLASMFAPGSNHSLKAVVENNLMNQLTLEEFAFLANRSLSSFKRDFQKTYGVSPQRYIRERRLEMASADLANGRSAGEVYLDYGYQHLSNFNTAFKKKYGLTPSDYRSRQLI